MMTMMSFTRIHCPSANVGEGSLQVHEASLMEMNEMALERPSKLVDWFCSIIKTILGPIFSRLLLLWGSLIFMALRKIDDF